MKVFVIGSNATPPDSDGADPGDERLHKAGRGLGAALASGNHELVVCSPFRGSLDVSVMEGFTSREGPWPAIHRHSPTNKVVVDAWEALLPRLGNPKVYTYRHPAWSREDDRAKAWLAAQLGGMENSDVIVALGGRVGGSSERLLDLADSTGRGFLPLPHMGGSARESFRKNEWKLRDQLGPDMYARLAREADLEDLVPAIEQLISRPLARAVDPSTRFFLSYSRVDALHADTAEATLRRRRLRVFRDEETFSPDAPLPEQIKDWIQRADVMVVLYSRNHAASPWCYDELTLAFERNPRPEIWMLRLDDTRVVHPRVRELPFFDARDRDGLVLRIEYLLSRQ